MDKLRKFFSDKMKNNARQLWMPAIALAAILAISPLTLAGFNNQGEEYKATTATTATHEDHQMVQDDVSSTSTDNNTPIGGLNLVLPAAFGQVSTESAQQLKENGAPVRKFTLVAYETQIALPTGENTTRLTFNGTDPAPTLRARQGEIIEITIINHPDNIRLHSVDHHAATISAVPNFGAVDIGQNRTYTFVAKQPGFFKYHCEGEDVLGMDEHVFSGMVGGFIVDPANGYGPYANVEYTYDSSGKPQRQITHEDGKAKEFTLQFSELYLTESGEYNADAMYAYQPTWTTINGIPFGYDPAITQTPGAMPLHVKAGDHVRFFVLNAGNIPVNFHIVGEQLDRVVHGGRVQGQGLQTYLVGGSNDAIIDVIFDEPGVYAIVNHDYSALFKGQVAIVVVDDANGENPLNYKGNNPSNAVPPPGIDTIRQETTPYYAGTPM
jgi:nitrite reductase (NO-forming)